MSSQLGAFVRFLLQLVGRHKTKTCQYLESSGYMRIGGSTGFVGKSLVSCLGIDKNKYKKECYLSKRLGTGETQDSQPKLPNINYEIEISVSSEICRPYTRR